MFICLNIYSNINIQNINIYLKNIEREQFKKLAHAAVGRGGQVQEFRVKSVCCCASLKAICWQNPLLLGEGQSSVLLRSSLHWMRPTHILEGNLHYPESTDLNVHLI